MKKKKTQLSAAGVARKVSIIKLSMQTMQNETTTKMKFRKRNRSQPKGAPQLTHQKSPVRC
jgi:hypothetical protein